MTKEYFKEVVDLIFGAYHLTDKLNDTVYDSWFHFMKNKDASIFLYAAEEWITKEPKFPSISDILKIMRTRGLALEKERELQEEKEPEITDEEWLEMMRKSDGD